MRSGRVYAQELATALRELGRARVSARSRWPTRAGLTRYTYQKYEKGESRPGSPANPTLRTMLALSQVLGVTVANLIPPDAPDLRSR